MPRMKKQRYVCLPHTGVLELWCVFLHPQAALIVDGKVGLVSSLFVTAKGDIVCSLRPWSMPSIHRLHSCFSATPLPASLLSAAGR